VALAVLKAARARHRHPRSAGVLLTLISGAERTLPRIASCALARQHRQLKVGP
jgi:hypothetical protein